MSKNKIRKTAINITRWVGSPASVLVHTILFIASFFAVYLEFVDFQDMLLILTTIVSLEAIYLAIFIQMTLNYTSEDLEEVSEDIEELQEDIGEIQEDVGELTEDVGEMSEEGVTEEAEEEVRNAEQKRTLEQIQADLRKLTNDISRLQGPKQ